MKKNKKLVIFGGGETALLAYEYFTYDSDYEVVAFAMDHDYIVESELNKKPVIDIKDAFNKYPPAEYYGFVAASSKKLNRIRKQLYVRVRELGYTCASYISSRAFVWKNVKIGQNCFILEDNTLQPFTEVGENVVMWSGNHLGHRSAIQNHCFISSHCVISGYCDIGESSFLGVNCTVENNVRIERDNFIGAGAIIRKDTAEKCFYQTDSTPIAKIDSHRLFRIKEK